MDYQNYNYQNNYQTNYRPPAPRTRIDNIFSALIYEKTAGVYMEFSLWCTVCVVAVLSMIAAVLGGGKFAWIMLMFFAIGMGVLMAFRLKPITLLYGTVAINFIMFLLHFLSFVYYNRYGGDPKYSVFNTILFILLIITSVVIMVLAFIHFFTRMNFGNVIALMVIIQSGCAMMLHILLFACPFIGDGASEYNEYVREYMNDQGYWIGTISFWMLLIVISLFYGFFFWGCIDSRKGKIINVSGMPMAGTGAVPGLRCTRGTYAGQVIQLQGRELIIGSKESHIVIADPYVSSRHCLIRFNTSTGYYEVCDCSSNGTYLHTGARLQKNTYTSVQRGSVIWVGSQNQQFQLM